MSFLIPKVQGSFLSSELTYISWQMESEESFFAIKNYMINLSLIFTNTFVHDLGVL